MAKRKKTSEAGPVGAEPLSPREASDEVGPDGESRPAPAELSEQSAEAPEDSRPGAIVEDGPEASADARSDDSADDSADVSASALSDELPEASVEEPFEDDLPAVESPERLTSILESLIFATDKPLTLAEMKRLLATRDIAAIEAALESLRARYQDTGILLIAVAGGVQFRTNPVNGPWVSKLVAGRPVRLSRAMMETLAIVAYRQPITRPEIDEIRGVDSGPVLRTLLDRGLIRTLGKKEEVGRPLLYGTTPDFLKTFSMKDLTELPSLREFHELGEADMARVNATSKGAEALPSSPLTGPPPGSFPRPTDLSPPDPKEEEELLSALDDASSAAARATKQATEPTISTAEGDSTSS